MNLAPKISYLLPKIEGISKCQSIGAIALLYAQMGWPIFPCQEKGKNMKAPYTSHGFKDASTDETKIKEWWDQHPQALIGLPTGPETGLLVIDCDIRENGDGVENYKRLLDDHEIQEFPCILTVETPSGGTHYYYAHPPVKTPIKSKLTDYVDIKAEGGYVIAPGSQLSDGRNYHWKKGFDPFLRDLKHFPSDLLNLITKKTPFENNYPHLNSNNPNEIEVALGFIPADDYQIWLHVGMGLKKELGESGFEMWNQWSKTSPKKYDHSDQRKTWDSFKGQGVNIQTIFYYARKHGCDLSELARDKQGKEKPLTTTLTDNINPQSEQISTSTKMRNSSFIPIDINLSLNLRDDWLVEDMLFKGDIAMLVGKESVGKSFIAIDLATCIATGSSWADQSVRQCPVLYLANEGIRGIEQRFKAQVEKRKYIFEHEIIPLACVTSDLDLCSDKSEAKLLEAMADFKRKFQKRPGLIIIDTLAQAFGGDENLSAHMRDCLVTIRSVIRQTDATFLLIHHYGKDLKNGPRGHSSLAAACDTIFSVEKTKKEISFKEIKQKDADCSFKTKIHLTAVTLENPSKNSEKPITTCLPDYEILSSKGVV